MRKVPRLLTIILPILLFAFLALFLYADFIAVFEDWVYAGSVGYMPDWFATAMKIITHMGGIIAVVVICFAMFVMPRVRKTYAIPVSAAVVISAVSNLALKQAFARERPNILRLINETNYSFPSGHAMINMALYATIVLLTFKNIESMKNKTALIIVCAALTFLIGFSRIFLGVHYVTDVIGGWCLGLVVAALVTWLHERRMGK